MARSWLEFVRRGWRKPPRVILRWAARQVLAEVEQVLAPWRARRLTRRRLLRALDAGSVDGLWARLAGLPFPARTRPIDPAHYDRACPGDRDRILAAAQAALDHRVNLLGSGPVELGGSIDWHRDFKTGHCWPVIPSRRIDYRNPERQSDIKVPWELSRLQWLIPAGQAYLLTGEDRYAEAVRQVVEDWSRENPVAQGINWACTMDVALRAVALTWFFHVFQGSAAWADGEFRLNYLRLLYIHGDFISRHLEWADVNGNHLTADLAGLVFVGLFFGQGRGPDRWQARGWRFLRQELPLQVTNDGVNFESSTAYHRLVLELFLWPALYRRARGLEVDAAYRDRMVRMAEFITAYSRQDGSTPLWGDADDGRFLPFGGQAATDHRHLAGLAGLALEDETLAGCAVGPLAEIVWALGPDRAAELGNAPMPSYSRAFDQGGVYVMGQGGDHVFVDCGPVGFAGRGGHGHNDCLSLEVMLDGRHLLTDCGTYLYTASPQWRNRLRGTAAHNTPMIDGEELNRFVRPDYLWTLHDDARPEVRRWDPGSARDVLVGSHTGYLRLADPVRPVRGIMVEKAQHRLIVADRFEGQGEHRIAIPYHLAPGVAVEQSRPGLWRLNVDGQFFCLIWRQVEDWQVTLKEGWQSPSYGVKVPIGVVEFARQGPLVALTIAIVPEDQAAAITDEWLDASVADIFPSRAG